MFERLAGYGCILFPMALIGGFHLAKALNAGDVNQTFRCGMMLFAVLFIPCGDLVTWLLAKRGGKV